MGLFDAFKKKQCDICGEEIGLLGNKKLEDGNMCKTCAKKLSPWFSDRRHSTLAEIKEQLAYREENKARVAEFRTTRTFGEYMKLLIDEDAGVFMVTSERDLEEANPDVIAFGDVTGCNLDIDESRTEIMREDKDGNKVSYTPRRYNYDFDFYMIIHVRNPYFDEIRFRLNSSSLEIESRFPSASAFAERDADYRYYKEMGEEIRQLLLESRKEAREAAAVSAAPKMAVTCPYCGATTMPDAAGCCEYCGGAVNN